MKQGILGATGISVSQLCFGSLPFSPLQRDWDTQEAGQLLGKAFEMGVNFVDTAQYYRNYAHICAGLRHARRPVVLASKTYAHTRPLCQQAVEEARTALDRDVIDIFLLHEQESEHTLRGHAEALDCLYDYKARGVIRAVGLSTHHVAGVDAAVQAGLDVVHPLLNLTGVGIADGHRTDMERAIDRASSAGLGVYTMKALGGGTLFRQAHQALEYALSRGDSIALGIRDYNELQDDVHFFEHGCFPNPPMAGGQNPRSLWIGQWCIGCGACAAACGAGALSIDGGRAVCDDARCVLCGYCAGHCPDFCIKII